MKRFGLFVALCLVPFNLNAGQLGTRLPWISGTTAEADLVLNNDDYNGEFADNPNRFKVNEPRIGANWRQSIVDTERMIATAPSGGTTEYAVSIGGHYFDGDARPGVNLDSVFQVQLGFGTADNFVRALDVAPDLRFDMPDSVSPVIEDFFITVGDIPILKLMDHQTDTLVYQGSSSSGAVTFVNFARGELFKLPLDIPDLPTSVRDMYTADALARLADTEVPFTIRVGPVPVSSVPGDFDGDGLLSSADINLLAWESGTGDNNLNFDLTDDGMVNGDDVMKWILAPDIGNSWVGDSNFDREFNSGDMVEVFTAGKYELDEDANWSEGDWTGDHRFDSGDLVAAFTAGGYEQGPRAAIGAVPEPSAAFLFATGLCGLVAISIFRRRK